MGGGQGAARGAVADAGCPCRVLEALWELLLQAILQALGANLDVSTDFYGRFHFALEVGPWGGVVPAGAPGLPGLKGSSGILATRHLLSAHPLCQQHLGPWALAFSPAGPGLQRGVRREKRVHQSQPWAPGRLCL